MDRVLLWAVLALLLLNGCGPAAPTGHVDLLELSPPVLDDDDRTFPPALRREFDFSDGLPDGVTAGPPGVQVTLVEGGIRLVAHTPPWIEFRSTVDGLRYQGLHAWLGPTDGTNAELYFAFTDPPQFNLGNRRARELSPGQDQYSCVFPLPQPDAVRVPLEVFRLYPGGRGSTHGVIQRLELSPRGPVYLARSILNRERVDLAQDYRRCWRFCGSGERTVSLRVPGGDPVLYFGSGTLVGSRRARLRVILVEDNGEETELWKQSFGPAGRGWIDRRFDLSHWEGDSVTLRFEVRANRPGVYLVGNPVVRSAADRKLPGVLLVLIDTVRADRMSTYGHSQWSTPHFDRLSREGILFSRVAAPSSWTLPSTAALLTGRYPDELKIRETGGPAVPDDIPTLAEQLSAEGFTTGAFVANFGLSPFRGFGRGFDAYYVAPFSEKLMRADQLNQLALDWVSAHRDERLFCYVHYMDPHAPYDAPTAEHPGGRGEPEFDIDRGHNWRDGNIVPLIMGWQQVDDPGGVDMLRRYYDEEISWVDRQVGDLLARLDDLGVLENMIVVVTSDHGEEFLDHGNWSHGLTLYEELIHVPMVLKAPSLEQMKGTVVHRPVTLIDVAPTIAGLCGLQPVAGAYSGGDLLEDTVDRTLFSQTRAGQAPLRFGVIQGRYKYAFFDREAAVEQPPTSIIGRRLMENGPPAEILIDLWEDPLEQHNLIHQRPELAEQLRELMRRRFAEMGETAAPAAGEPEVDPDTAERLRALGYME